MDTKKMKGIIFSFLLFSIGLLLFIIGSEKFTLTTVDDIKEKAKLYNAGFGLMLSGIFSLGITIVISLE